MPSHTTEPSHDAAVAPLWITMRGATVRVVLGWVAWTLGAVAVTALVAAALGPAGPVVGILTVGWLLARRFASPLERLRRYHLDDTEVMALGPWWRVQRITWAQVEQVTQERHALVLSGAGRAVPLPLRALLDT